MPLEEFQGQLGSVVFCSGCGSVGEATDTGHLRFESSQRQVLFTINCFIPVLKRRK